MKIDDAVRAKLVKAVEKAGGAKDFAVLCGINAANISRYLRGITLSITDGNWEKLAPFLENSDIQSPAVPENNIVIPANKELCRFLIKKMEISPYKDVEQLRRKINYSSYELLRRQLNGKLNWFADTLARVLEVLNIDIDGTPLSSENRRIVEAAAMKQRGDGVMRLLPVVTVQYYTAIPAGMPRLDAVPVARDDRRDLYAFRLYGALMEPEIRDGDIVVAETADLDRNIADGTIAVVKIFEPVSGGSRIMCRRFYHDPTSGGILLTCGNPAGAPQLLKLTDVIWTGVVRSIIRLLS